MADDLTQALKDLTQAVKDQNRSQRTSGGPRAGLARDVGKSQGGMLSKQARTVAAGNLLSSGVGKVASLAASGVAATASAAGAGIISAQRGGSFAGGTARGLASAVGTGFVGELLGTAAATRVSDNAQGRLNNLTNEVSALGGSKAIGPKVRGFLADLQKTQAQNIEEDQQANKAEIDKRFGTGKDGDAAGLLRQILDALQGIASGIGGLI